MKDLAICEDGIYFGLPEEDYHAQPRLSNSGIKHLLCSPTDFWVRSWMNPDREMDEDDSAARQAGNAYHARILEGKDAFYSRYYIDLDPANYPDAIRTVDELKAALPEGEKKSGSKPVLIERLLASNPDAIIWDTLKAEHEQANEGKIPLAPDFVKRIEIAAAFIEKHPDLSKAFTGGYPEVSIFWTDENGIKMKSRVDYLKMRATVDLKSFGNQFGKPIDYAVTYSMASYKYHYQAAVYDEAVRAAKDMLKVHGPKIVSGEVDQEWLEKFAGVDEWQFLFVFQQTGVAPVARGYVFPRNLTYDCGRIAVNEAKRRYLECLETYGTDYWIDMTDVRSFDDDEFPVFMTA